jgi:DNA gyrase subunit B
MEEARPPSSPDGPKKKEYTEDSIKILEGMEAVRKRPDMYIMDTGPRGLHHLVYEVVDNSVDEALAGVCDRIDVKLHADGSCSVLDNGRGIPVKEHKEAKKSTLEVVMTVLHAGGKFDHESYKVSGGLHGVGVSCVNALSEWLESEVYRDGHVYAMRFERGIPKTKLEIRGKTDAHGTKQSFKPDTTIFQETTQFSYDVLANRLRQLAFLNRGTTLTIADERTDPPKAETFYYAGGIQAFVQYLNEGKEVIHPEVIYVEGRTRPRGSRSSSRSSTTTPSASRSTASRTTSTPPTAGRTSRASAPRSRGSSTATPSRKGSPRRRRVSRRARTTRRASPRSSP